MHSSMAKTTMPLWKLPPHGKFKRQYRGMHDRYLVIDGEVEIILTSGIDYLFDDEKECTIIVRKLDSDLLR